MAWRSKTIIDIKTRLLAQVPAVKTVGRYNGQPESFRAAENNDIAFPVPAVFVELAGGGEWIIRQDQVRYNDTYNIRLHIVQETFRDEYSQNADLAAALAHLDFLDGIINALDQWTGAEFADRFTFLDEEIDAAATHVIVHVLSFTAKVFDDSLAEANAPITHKAEQDEIVRTGTSQHDAIIGYNQVEVIPEEDNPYIIQN